MSYDHRTIEGFDKNEDEIIRDITSKIRSGESLDLEKVSLEYRIPSSQAVIYVAEAGIRANNSKRYEKQTFG